MLTCNDKILGRIRMNVKVEIEKILQDKFTPVSLNVIDESHLHRGHAGWREGGETHFRVEIVSAKFDELTRIQRHRAINEALALFLENGVHALAIKADVPE